MILFQYFTTSPQHWRWSYSYILQSHQLEATMLEMVVFHKVAELLTREQNVTDDLVAAFKQELELRVVTQIPQEVGLQ